MTTKTTTTTETTTINAVQPVQDISVKLGLDITKLVLSDPRVSADFDIDQTLVDVSLLLFNDVSRDIRLQFYKDGVVQLEYSYVVADSALTEHGRPAGETSVAGLPAGSRVRVIIIPNGRRPQDYVEGWLTRLGWVPAEELEKPADGILEKIGAFAHSSGYGVERTVWKNPRLERVVASFVSSVKEFRK